MELTAFYLAVLVLTLVEFEKGFCSRQKNMVKTVRKHLYKPGRYNGDDQSTHRNPPSGTSTILESLLQQQNYDKRIRPDENKKALKVGINVYFNTVSSLDEENMEFDIDIYLRQIWSDERLNYTSLHNASNSKFIVIDPPDQVWTPDIFLENSKQASFHMVTKKNEMLRLWPNGILYYSVRIKATVSCYLELYRFPVDVQKCLVKFGCFKYAMEDVSLFWEPWANGTKVLISPNVKFAKYTIAGIEATREIAHYDNMGSYTYLVVGVTFKRDIGHYILQQYMPCSYIVLLSWVCFWIEADCVGDRISIGVTLVLTIVLLQGSLNTNMPKVSYSKYIDYYFNFCLAFLMTSIIESLVVYKFHRMQIKNNSKVLDPRISSQSLYMLRTRKENCYWDSIMDDRRLQIHPSMKSIRDPGTATNDMSQRIDKIARMIFPIAFVIFNIMYHSYFNIV